MKETLQQLEQRAAAEVRDRAEQDLANRLLAIGDAAAPSRQRRALQAVALVTVLAVVGGMLAVQLRSDDLVVTADDPTTGIDEPSDPTPTTSIPDGTPCSEAELATGRRWPLDESEEEIEIDPVVFSEAQRAQVVEAFQSSSDPDLSNLVEEPLEDAGGGDPEIERALNLQLIPGPNTDSKVSVFAYRTVGQLCETAGSMAEGDSSWDAVLRHEGGLVVGLQQQAQLQQIVVGPTYAFSVVIDNDVDPFLVPPVDASPTEATREVERIARVLNGLPSASPDESGRAPAATVEPAEAGTASRTSQLPGSVNCADDQGTSCLAE